MQVLESVFSRKIVLVQEFIYSPQMRSRIINTYKE
jgi:hypothetical protein